MEALSLDQDVLFYHTTHEQTIICRKPFAGQVMLSQLRREICHFSPEIIVTIRHEKNNFRSTLHLDGTTDGQTIICRQLFAGHAVGSRPM